MQLRTLSRMTSALSLGSCKHRYGAGKIVYSWKTRTAASWLRAWHVLARARLACTNLPVLAMGAP